MVLSVCFNWWDLYTSSGFEFFFGILVGFETNWQILVGIIMLYNESTFRKSLKTKRNSITFTIRKVLHAVKKSVIVVVVVVVVVVEVVVVVVVVVVVAVVVTVGCWQPAPKTDAA